MPVLWTSGAELVASRHNPKRSDCTTAKTEMGGDWNPHWRSAVSAQVGEREQSPVSCELKLSF